MSVETVRAVVLRTDRLGAAEARRGVDVVSGAPTGVGAEVRAGLPTGAGAEVRAPLPTRTRAGARAEGAVRPAAAGAADGAASVAVEVWEDGLACLAARDAALWARADVLASAAPAGPAVSEARIGVIVSSARPEPATARAPWWRAALARLNSRAVRTHFGTVAGVVILGALLWRLGTGVLLDGLRSIDATTLVVSLLIGVATTVLSAWRWALVARGLRIRLPLGPAVADYYRALFLNAALPGGVLGDVHRAVRHGQSAGDMGRGVRSVVLERVAGQVALTVVGGAVLLTMPSPVLAQTRHFAPLAGLAAVGALAVMVALRMNRAPSRRGRALRATLAEAREGLLSRRNWPGVVVSSVLVLAGHIAMFVLAARVAGSGASVAALLPLAILALIAMGLPLNVGGFGPREGVAAWAFGAAGLGASSGVAVSVVYGVLSFVAALPGLVVLVARWCTGLRAGSGTAAAAAPDPARERDYPRALPAAPVSPVSVPEPSAEVRSEKYAPKESAKAASSSFPFSAEPSEGRPMTPESV